jgi:hypothetical protein
MHLRRCLPLVLLVLAGCAPYTLVRPERQTVGGVLSVQPGTMWNRVTVPAFAGKIEVWTLDGTVLNFLMFFTGTADGEPLFTRRGEPGGRSGAERLPVFRSTMNPLEIEELFKDTLARNLGSPIVETRGLRAVTLGGGPGFHFETRAVGRDEVERSGVVTGAIRGGRLYAAWFQGARLHYFERYLPEFDRLVGSAQLVGEAAR